MIKITFPSFDFANDADKYELAASVRFSWLNFSSEIRLYLTYFQNGFKISTVIISTISSFIFTHIQPICMQTSSFNFFLFSVKLSHHMQTHLLALCHIYVLSVVSASAQWYEGFEISRCRCVFAIKDLVTSI